jgi:hypothetical protein
VRDHLAVLCCDAPGCGAQITGPATELTTTATTAGWQVTALTRASVDEDDVDLATVDRCPLHPVEALDPAAAAAGLHLDPRMITTMITRRRTLT